MASRLSKVFTVRYDNNLDAVDIQAASNVVVLYLVSKLLDFNQQTLSYVYPARPRLILSVAWLICQKR